MEIKLTKKYGPHDETLRFDLPSGYVVIVGENDAGKTSLLQWLFRHAPITVPMEETCYIPKHRDFIRDSIEVGGQNYHQFVSNFRNNITDQPISSDDVGTYRIETLFALILQRSNFLKQMGEVTNQVAELGLGELNTTGSNYLVNGIPLSKHGSGLRNLMCIAAAVTCKDLKYIFIDEPEVSLETKKLKALKELFLSVAKKEGKTIVITTHSHMLLNDKEYSNNLVLKKDGSTTNILPMTKEMLPSVAFEMLGNSFSDLYLPDNYVLVEGSSDQAIVQRVKELMGITKDLRIFSCGSNQNIRPTVESLNSMFGPILENKSPYSKNAVALLDLPNAESQTVFDELKRCLNRDASDERLFVLDKPSLEEYLDEQIYKDSALEKQQVLDTIEAAQGYVEKAKVKTDVCRKIEKALTVDHLSRLGVITACLERAAR